MNAYKTLAKHGEAVIIEKRSRFIAGARPIASEDEAQAFLAQVRKKYWDASHHVFAYILGNQRRASDDGEPQGSSGPPVLNILAGAELSDAMIIVTRYFGGTLLGVGGLVRAYSQAAREAVANAGIIEKRLCRTYRAELDYPLWERVRRVGCATVTVVEYGERVSAEFVVEASAAAEFLAAVSNASDGGAQLVFCGEGFTASAKTATGCAEEKTH